MSARMESDCDLVRDEDRMKRLETMMVKQVHKTCHLARYYAWTHICIYTRCYINVTEISVFSTRLR